MTWAGLYVWVGNGSVLQNPGSAQRRQKFYRALAVWDNNRSTGEISWRHL